MSHIFTNQLVLSATIIEVEPLRYTPAGLPALNLRLEHASEISEAGLSRQVKVNIRSVALGAVAEQLAVQDIGSKGAFKGFLASPHGGKNVVFHLQEFAKESSLPP